MPIVLITMITTITLLFILSFITRVFPKQFPKLTAFFNHTKWACNFLLHYSVFRHDQLFEEKQREEESSVSCYEEEGAAVECAVCLCKMEEGDEIRELRCNHIFHKVCLDRWCVYGRAICPICRDNLAPRRAVAAPAAAAESQMEVVVLKFCPMGNSHRDTWWLR